MNKALLEWISVSGRLLGSLFYYAPNDEQVKTIFPIFSEPNWDQQWPIQHSEIKNLIEQGQKQNLAHAYQYLFIGPNDLPAPPWSSVYLDRESVIFGESLLNLRTFLQKYQIEFSQNMNEPEDHFGLMLMLAAFLAEQKTNILAEYLTEHLFTWAYRYLTLLSEQTDYPFYQGIALLTQDTLQFWQEQANLQIKTPLLYR